MAARLRNWAGDVRWRPARIDRPGSQEELVACVRRSAMPIRVMGAGHSFSALCATDHQTIHLDRLSGLLSVDRDREEATVRAGTRLRDLGPLLARRGLAVENQGDIDTQSLGGVLATGTHGTGTRLGCIASQVLELTLVTGSGDTLILSRQRDERLFRAAAVSLGALGILSQVRLKLRPAYRLSEVRRRVPLDQCLADNAATAARHRHFEFFWFPYADLALTKTLDLAPAAERPPDRTRSFLTNLLLENFAFWLTCQTSRLRPAWTPAINAFCSRTLDESEYLGPPHRIFPSPRLVRFHEMEYAVPAENGPDCLRELREFIVRRRLPVSFPIEYRYVGQDDLFLSPFFGRDSATLSLNVFHPNSYREYFDGAEAIFHNHAGRPHWGKKHTAGPAYLRRLYPHWDDFQMIREELDPGGRFLNPYLRGLFLGLDGTPSGHPA
ncbi:MAG: D-arabinono-1,4-lactone oxidase [Candidatus Polarisedimenticolia bacterium]